LSWEPEWEERVIEHLGIRVKAKVDRSTGLIECPICGRGDKPFYTFSSRDLILHLLAHARGLTHAGGARTEEPEERELVFSRS
jgi:hypothetical protein